MVTLDGHEDNTLLATIVRRPGHGKVIVIDGHGSTRCAMLGDKNARLAADNGWEGIIGHGVVRDASQLAVIDIGVKALGTVPRRSHKNGACVEGASVTFGGVVFHPGTHVVSDDDGIVVLPR